MSRLAPIALGALICLFSPTASAQPGAESEGMIEARLGLDVSSIGEDGGGERVGAMQLGRLRAGQSRRISVRLPADKCFVAVAVGGPGVHNMDVSLSSGRTVLARDTGTDVTAVARFCNTERARTARLTITAFRGGGQFAGALYVQDPEEAAAQQAALEGESALNRLTSLVERHGAGMRAVNAPTRETLQEGEQVERSLQLSPGRCYRVLAAGERRVVDLDLRLVGPGGETLQRDASEDASPTLGVLAPLCPATPGDYRLQMKLERGEGAFAWQVLGNAPRSNARIERETETYRVGGAGNSYVSSQIRRAHGQHASGGRAITDLLGGRLATGDEVEHRFRATGGQCYVVLVAAVPSARDLDLEVRDQFGNEQAADTGPGASPHARVCPRVSGSFSARVRMFEGYGAYGLQIFVTSR